MRHRFSDNADESVIENELGLRLQQNGDSESSKVWLRALPQSTSLPLETDNTQLSRATRAISFSLVVEEPTNSSNAAPSDGLKIILQALFSVKHADEWIRLEIPASLPFFKDIISLLLESGVAISSPYQPPSLLLCREAYWQGALSPKWYWPTPSSSFPLVYTYAETGRRHPVRQPKPHPGTVLYQRYIPHLGEVFTLRVVDPARTQDINLFSTWQNNPRVAAAWAQMGTVDEHREYLQKQTADAHQIPVFGSFNGIDCLYTELYWVSEDSIVIHLDRHDPFDRGFHILVGSESHRGPHRVQAWASSIVHALFLADTRTQRVLMEPRASNTKIIEYMCSSVGFAVTKHFDFPHKRSALLELSRERFFQLAPFHYVN